MKRRPPRGVAALRAAAMPARQGAMVRVWLCLVMLACVVSTAMPHPLAPSLLEVTELGAGRLRVRWKTPSRRVPGSRTAPVFPADCQTVGEPRTTFDVTEVVTEWTLRCRSETLVGSRFAIDDIAGSKAAVLVRFQLADGRRLLSVLGPQEDAFVVPERPTTMAVLRSYAQLGIGHILTGLDHLLFVLGLILLVGGGRLLLWTVTAFTVGHSLTLSLAVLGFVNFPTGVIEVLIAVSIFVLAVELSREGPHTSLLARRPWVMAFAFGLLHGLGFAGALAEVGLPSGDIPLALFSFNAGIEVGQLSFVIGVLLVARLMRRPHAALPVRLDWVPAYAIGSLSVYWILQRMAAL